MGSRNAFIFTDSSSGYLKPASLYDGESFTESSFYSNSSTYGNSFISSTTSQADHTYEQGAENGGTTLGRSSVNSGSFQDEGVTSSSQFSYDIKRSNSISSTSSSYIANRSVLQLTDNTVITESFTATAGDGPVGDETITWSSESGGTTTRVNLRNITNSTSNSADTVRSLNELSFSRTRDENVKTQSYEYQESSTDLVKSTYITEDEGGNTGYENTQYATSRYTSNRTVITSRIYGSGSSLSRTITAGATGTELTAEYTRERTSEYGDSVDISGGFTRFNEYTIENATSTTNSSNIATSEYTGNTVTFSSETSNTFAAFVTVNSKIVNTTSDITNSVYQSTTLTSSQNLGSFFNQQVTQRYTRISSADTIEQSSYGQITTTAPTDSWDDTKYDFLTDKTILATGGVYGFIPNLKQSISDSFTISTKLSEADSSYVLDGESWIPLNEILSSTRGTETSQQSITLSTTVTLTETIGIDYTFTDRNLSDTYSYYKSGGQTGTNYLKNGYLGATIITADLTTGSINIYWGQSSSSSTEGRATTDSTYDRIDSPSIQTSVIYTSSTTAMGSYFGSEEVSTYVRSSISNISSTSSSYISTRNGSNITWQSLDNRTLYGQFDRLSLKAIQISAASYESMNFANGEKPFCSVTNTNRQSRNKATPPDIDYKEFFLTTTVDSDSVTKYSQSTRTADSWFIPQARSSSINGMIYVPKDENFEIIDHGTNTMSFSGNNQNTQIVQVTFSNVSSGLTRSTISKFVRFFTVGGGLQTKDQPKSFSQTGFLSFSPEIMGGDNAYSDNGTAFLYKDCTATILDISGGSTVFTNKESDNNFTSSTLPTGMVYISAKDQLFRVSDNFKNNYILTRR